MKIKLDMGTIDRILKKIDKNHSAHIFNLHEGLESLPVICFGGEAKIMGQIPLKDIPYVDSLLITVNSLNQELLDIYSLMEYGLWYNDLEYTETTELKNKFYGEYKLDIYNPVTEEIIGYYGLGNKDLRHKVYSSPAIRQILTSYYSDATILDIMLVEEDNIFFSYINNTAVYTKHHTLDEIKLLNSRAVDHIERKMEELTKTLDLHKKMEREFGLDVDISLDKKV